MHDSHEVEPVHVAFDEPMEDSEEVEKAMGYEYVREVSHDRKTVSTSRSSEEVADYLPVGRGMDEDDEEGAMADVDVEDDGEGRMVELGSDLSDGFM